MLTRGATAVPPRPRPRHAQRSSSSRPRAPVAATAGAAVEAARHNPPRSAASRGSVAPSTIFAAAVVFFSVLEAVYWNPSLAKVNDARYYVKLAQHPLHFSAAPWGFRILTPYLVWLIHAGTLHGFAIVTVVSLAATAAILYAYLLEFFTPQVALFGVAIFAISPAAISVVQNPVDVDGLFFATVALAFLALARHQWLLLGTTLFVGVFVKETTLFILVPMAVVGYSDSRFRPYGRWVALVVAPVVAFLLLHFTPLVFDPVPVSYNYFSLANISFVFHQQHLTGGGGYAFFWAVVDSFGALWIVAALTARRSQRFLKQSAIFLVPVLGSVLIADNWSRMLSLGFIIVIPLVCSAGLDRKLAAAVLFFSYDAIVSIGINNLLGHTGYALEIPLLLVSLGAAVAVAYPSGAPLTLAGVSDRAARAISGVGAHPQRPAVAAASANGMTIAASGFRYVVTRSATAANWQSTAPASAASASARPAPPSPIFDIDAEHLPPPPSERDLAAFLAKPKDTSIELGSQPARPPRRATPLSSGLARPTPLRQPRPERVAQTPPVTRLEAPAGDDRASYARPPEVPAHVERAREFALRIGRVLEATSRAGETFAAANRRVAPPNGQSDPERRAPVPAQPPRRQRPEPAPVVDPRPKRPASSNGRRKDTTPVDVTPRRAQRAVVPRPPRAAAPAARVTTSPGSVDEAHVPGEPRPGAGPAWTRFADARPASVSERPPMPRPAAAGSGPADHLDAAASLLEDVQRLVSVSKSGRR